MPQIKRIKYIIYTTRITSPKPLFYRIYIFNPITLGFNPNFILKHNISLFKLTIIVATLLSCSPIFAQKDSMPVHKNKLSAFPVAYYSPETKLAVGALAAYTFYNKNDNTQKRPSQIQLGAAYTFNKQLLFYIPFRIYTRQSSFVFYGEAGYYKYSYYFYGIGNKQSNDYKELYKVNYPRIRVNLLRRINPHFYAGVRYWLEEYKIIETEPGKQLATALARQTGTLHLLHLR